MADWTRLDEDLTTPAFFTTPAFHAAFERLRTEDPVHWTTGRAVRPFWSITRHADCVAVLEDAHGFSSRLGGIMPLTADEPPPEQRVALGFDSIPTFLDPPRHQEVRRPFNRHFAAPAMARLRGAIAQAVDAILGEVLPVGACATAKTAIRTIVAQSSHRLSRPAASSRTRVNW